MKNISYLLSLLLAFSYVSFADEEVKEAPKESEEVAEDVESGGIDISYTGGYIDDIKDEIEAYRAKIISGEITVPSSR